MSRLQLRDRVGLHPRRHRHPRPGSAAGGLIYTNPAFDELLSRMRVVRLGQPARPAIHPSAERTLQQLHDSALSGLEERRTLRLRDVGGMAVWVSLTVSPVRERGKRPARGAGPEDVSAAS